MKQIGIALCILILFNACANKKQITHSEDYSKYIIAVSKTPQKLETEIVFWKKRLENGKVDVIAYSMLGSLQASKFEAEGNISDLIVSDSFFLLQHALEKNTSSGTFRSLAKNCISQHKFKLAKKYIDSALVLGDKKYNSLLMKFDVELELGNYAVAQMTLAQLNDKNEFNYLIRMAKLEDHKGNLSKAIELTEMAAGKPDVAQSKELQCWVKSNLGDMYAHNNEFDKAYAKYLQVLEINPNYYHCLKGIAWIAFTYDHNFSEAKLILESISIKHPIPDYNLMLSKIYKEEKNTNEYKKQMQTFMGKVQNPKYGDMYNKYIFYLMTEDYLNYPKALEIAKVEVNNRPTPESYNLLAWAYYKNGNTEMAYKIMNKNVINKNFEPDALYHIAEISAANRMKNQAQKYYELAQESVFELGPEYADILKKGMNEL